MHSWREPDQSTTLPDPMIHLPVLRPDKTLVIATDGFEGATAERTEIHRRGWPFLTPEMERRGTNTKHRCHRCSDCLLEWRDARSSHDTTDVVRAGALKCLDGNRDVIRWNLGVRVNTNNDLVGGRRNSRIQGRWRASGGIVDESKLRMLRSQLRCNVIRSIGRRSECEHDFQWAAVVLREQMLNRRVQVRGFLQHGNDDRNPVFGLRWHGHRDHRTNAAG